MRHWLCNKRRGEVSMSNRAVPGYVLEEMARRSVTNLLIVKPLNAYPGTFELSSWRSACTRVQYQYQKTSKTPKCLWPQLLLNPTCMTIKSVPGYIGFHPQTVKFCWTCTLVQFFSPPADQIPYQGGPIVKKYGLHPAYIDTGYY